MGYTLNLCVSSDRLSLTARKWAGSLEVGKQGLLAESCFFSLAAQGLGAPPHPSCKPLPPRTLWNLHASGTPHSGIFIVVNPFKGPLPRYTHPGYIITYPSGCRCTYNLLLFVVSGSWLHKVPGQEASPRNLLGRMNAQNPADLPAGHGGTCPNSRTWWQEDQVFKRRLGPSLAT